MRWPVNIPVIDELDLSRRNVYEHPPLDPYRGEYPRYLREPGKNAPLTKTVWVEAATHEDAVSKALQMVRAGKCVS